MRCGATNEWERGGACVGGGGSGSVTGAGVGVRARLAEERVGPGQPAFMLLCLDFVKDVDLIRKICLAVLFITLTLTSDRWTPSDF